MNEAIRTCLSNNSANFFSSSRRNRRMAAVLAAAAMTISAGRLGAATYTWDPGNGMASPTGGIGSWDVTPANTVWSDGTTDFAWTDTTGQNDTAIFANTAGLVTQDTNVGAAEVIFTTPGYSISSGANILLLATAGTTLDTSAIGSGAASLGNVDIGIAGETWNVGAAALTVNGAVSNNGQSIGTLTVNGTGTTQFTGGLTFSTTSATDAIVLGGSESVNISGPVQDGSANTGGNSITYNGTGTLSLTGTSNTFGTSTSTDKLTVDSGTLVIAAAGSLGGSSNPLVLSNNTAVATFEGTGSSTISIGNPVTLAGGGGGAATIGGSTPLNFTGSVTSTGAVENVNVTNTALTTISGNVYLAGAESNQGMVLGGTGGILISAMISDNALEGPGINPSSLTYNGTGTVTLTNTGNNFSGKLAIDNGTLAVASGAAGTGQIVLGNNTAAAVPIFEGIGASTISFGNPVSLGGGGGSASIIGGSTPLNFTGIVTGSGSSDDLNVNNTGGTTFSGTMYLSGSETNRTVNVGGTGSLLISAMISDNPLEGPGLNPATLNYVGTGTMTVTNTGNNFSGNLAVVNGTLIIPSDGVIGSSNTLAVGPASGTPTGTPTFESVGSSLVTISHLITIDSNSTSFATFGGTTPLNFSNTVTINTSSNTTETINFNDPGGVTFSSNVFLANGGSARTDTFAGADNITITGVLAGPIPGQTTTSSLTYSGTGTLTLGNADTYTGKTTVNSGVLDVANTSGSATGTANVTMNGGILASGTVGSISGNVLAGTASHTIAPGGVRSVGSLTIGGMTSTSLTTLNFDLGTGGGEITNGDLLTLGSGTVSVGAGTLMTFGGTPVAGDDYRLIGDLSSGTVVDAIPLANFTLPAAPGGEAFALSNSVDAGFIDLVVSSTGPANLTWNNAGGALPSDGQTWDINANKNWNNGSPGNVVYTDGSNVTFNDANNSGSNPNAYNVTLSTLVSPGSVTVNNTTGNYTISSNGTIGGTGSLTKSGTGTLTLSTPNTYSGGTIVTAGKLVIGQAGSNATFTGLTLTGANTLTALPTGTLSVSGNGIVQLANGVTNQTFVTPPTVGAHVSSNINLTSLSLTGDGTLDIGNNRILIDYTTGNDPIATIKQWIAAGAADGNAPGAQPAIISSDVAADDASSGFSYGIGYADGADGVIAGLPSGEIEVMFTLLGDANLDGQVNTEDFTPFATNISKNGSWDQGDFNYDGSVNTEDFTPFSHDLSQTASFAASENGVLLSPLIGAGSISLTNVPEPATIGLVAIAGCGLLARRRRRY